MLPGIENNYSREDKYTKTVLQTLMSIISELIFNNFQAGHVALLWNTVTK